MKILKTRNTLAVKALFKCVLPFDEWDFPKKTHFWIVYDNNQMPVGFAACFKLAWENSAFLAIAGVLTEYRGQGIHTKMIKKRITWAKRSKYESIITYTEKNNDKSFENLQDCGFKLYIPHNKYAGDDFLYWIKYL